MKDQLVTQFIEFKDYLVVLAPKLAIAIVVLLLFWGLGRLLKRLFNNRFQRRWNNSIVVGFTGTAFQWMSYLIGLSLAMYVLGFAGVAGSLMAGAGVTAIVVGFAFKDIAENFLAGFILAINRPFKLNDIIEIEQYKGSVSAVNIRTTMLRMPDGRDVFIPNAMIIKNVLINFTRDGLIRQEFMIGLETSSDVIRARSLILHYLETDKNILKLPAPNVLVEGLGNFTVDIKVLFWLNTFEISEEPSLTASMETIRSRVIRQVKDILLREGFNLPNFVIDHQMFNAESPLSVKLQKEQ